MLWFGLQSSNRTFVLTSKALNILGNTLLVVYFVLNRWFLLGCGILIYNCFSGVYLVDLSSRKTQLHVPCLDFNHSVIHSRLILSYWSCKYMRSSIFFFFTASKNVGRTLLESVSHLKTPETPSLMVARLLILYFILFQLFKLSNTSIESILIQLKL